MAGYVHVRQKVNSTCSYQDVSGQYQSSPASLHHLHPGHPAAAGGGSGGLGGGSGGGRRDNHHHLRPEDAVATGGEQVSTVQCKKVSQIEIVEANRCVVGRRQPAVQGGDRRLRLAAARARVAAAERELQVVCRGNYSPLLISNSTTSIESVSAYHFNTHDG